MCTFPLNQHYQKEIRKQLQKQNKTKTKNALRLDMWTLRYLALVKFEFSGVVPSFSRFLARLFSWKHHQVNWKTRPLFRQVTDFFKP